MSPRSPGGRMSPRSPNRLFGSMSFQNTINPTRIFTAIFISKPSTILTSPPPGLPHQAGGGPQAARGDQTFSPPLQSLGLKRIEFIYKAVVRVPHPLVHGSEDLSNRSLDLEASFCKYICGCIFTLKYICHLQCSKILSEQKHFKSTVRPLTQG